MNGWQSGLDTARMNMVNDIPQVDEMDDQVNYLISLTLDGMAIAVLEIKGITFKLREYCSEREIEEGLCIEDIREIQAEFSRQANWFWN